MTAFARDRDPSFNTMRILVENSGYSLGNLGDAAMLQVALRRFRAFWPHARVQVLTARPDRLALLCPWGEPLTTMGRHLWFRDGGLLRRFHRLAPGLERTVRRRAPAVAGALARGGRCGEARAWSERSLRLGTRDGLLFFHRAEIERCAGNLSAARSWARKALERDPGFSVRWAPVARRLAG